MAFSFRDYVADPSGGAHFGGSATFDERTGMYRQPDGSLSPTPSQGNSGGGGQQLSPTPANPDMAWWNSLSPQEQAFRESQKSSASSGSGEYGKSNADYEALLQKYQQGIDVKNPDSVRQLAAKMQADGIPAEVSSDGLLIRVPGYDGGWVDARQDKAFAEGRGGIRGWAFQPYYGKEDFNRLVAEGRNPHTGEMALPGQQFSRDQDAPISGPGAQYGDGGLPPGYSMTGANNLASFNAPGIMAPWTEQFKAPTTTDNPGFQFALDRAREQTERSAAAKGTLLTGGLQRDLQDQAIGMANQDYGNAWNRAFDVYNMNRGTFWGNQQNTFGRLSDLSRTGLTAAGGYAGTNTDLITNQANAGAANTVGRADRGNQLIDNAIEAAPSVWDAIKPRTKPRTTSGTFNPGGYSA